MCTVSYIPLHDNDFVLTSNRDEMPLRRTIPPKFYQLGKTNAGFPKDETAGGSWIAASKDGRFCCLLNGAFEAHEKRLDYKQSRGKILTEVITSNTSPKQFFEEKDLAEVEPFTILSIEKGSTKKTRLSEFIWDGSQKHFQFLHPDKPYIWSSVTLYNKEHRNLRRQWFNRFITEKNGSISPLSILGFHSGTHTTNKSINVIMEREEGIKTVSITQIVAENGKAHMNYFDLLHQTKSVLEI